MPLAYSAVRSIISWVLVIDLTAEYAREMCIRDSGSCDILINQIRNPGIVTDDSMLLDTELIVRESTTLTHI